MSTEPSYTTKEVAKIIGTTPKRITQLVHSMRLMVRRVPNRRFRWAFTQEQLDKLRTRFSADEATRKAQANLK